jgi:hypothetical protein
VKLLEDIQTSEHRAARYLLVENPQCRASCYTYAYPEGYAEQGITIWRTAIVGQMDWLVRLGIAKTDSYSWTRILVQDISESEALMEGYNPVAIRYDGDLPPRAELVKLLGVAMGIRLDSPILGTLVSAALGDITQAEIDRIYKLIPAALPYVSEANA